MIQFLKKQLEPTHEVLPQLTHPSVFPVDMATRTVTRRSSSGAGVGDDAGGTITYELDEKTGIIRGSDGTEQMWVLVESKVAWGHSKWWFCDIPYPLGCGSNRDPPCPREAVVVMLPCCMLYLIDHMLYNIITTAHNIALRYVFLNKMSL